MWIYKGTAKAETYLYLPAPDALDPVPDELLRLLGGLELVMEIELHEERPLAREDARAVIDNLRTRGYHLQLTR